MAETKTSEIYNPDAKTNGWGANQFNLDPRQKLCWEYYASPTSETFGNAYKSALKAGYEDSYADTITVTEWFKVKVRRLNMLSKAEKVLDETLDMDDESVVMVGTTPLVLEGNIVKKIDPALKKIKQDTAKFIAERQGKDQGYSTKQEVEHSGEIKVPIVDLLNKIEGKEE